jgi:predicted ArsR family transcriptional regulator
MICDCPSDQACDICDPYGMWRKGRADIDKRLLRVLMTSPMRTIQMAMALGIPEDEVRWRMRRLQELGLVAYAGPEGN